MATGRRIEAVCRRHGVPLPAAALQFPLGHPRLRRHPGAIAPEQVEPTSRASATLFRTTLWAELKHEAAAG